MGFLESRECIAMCKDLWIFLRVEEVAMRVLWGEVGGF